jgi:hypothetical protein
MLSISRRHYVCQRRGVRSRFYCRPTVALLIRAEIASQDSRSCDDTTHRVFPAENCRSPLLSPTSFRITRLKGTKLQKCQTLILFLALIRLIRNEEVSNQALPASTCRHTRHSSDRPPNLLRLLFPHRRPSGLAPKPSNPPADSPCLFPPAAKFRLRFQRRNPGFPGQLRSVWWEGAEKNSRATRRTRRGRLWRFASFPDKRRGRSNVENVEMI